MSDYNVFECSRQPTAVIRGSLSVDELPGFIGRAIEQVAMTLTARGTPPTRAPFAFYPTVPGVTIDVEADFASKGQSSQPVTSCQASFPRAR